MPPPWSLSWPSSVEEEERRKRSEKVNEGRERLEERMSQATDAAVLPPESAVAEGG